MSVAEAPSLRGPSEGYVFIVTYGRSGSTLLQNLLNHIDGYCIRGENANLLFHLMSAWKTAHRSSPMRSKRQAGKPTTPDSPWFGAERVDPDQLARALGELFMREVLQPPEGTRVSGFKEIRFHNHPAQFRAYLNFMQTAFPGARFIFNTRDHTAVCRSGWWRNQKEARVRRILERAETLFRNYAKAFPDRCLTLHYDDYIADPTRFSGLFDFLGEAYDPELVVRVLDKKLQHLK